MPLKNLWDSFYRFPSNLKLFVVALLACNLAVSNFHCNEKSEDQTCPVDYQITNGGEFSLTGKWKFIGFEESETKRIEYPPCGENETFIIFTDSLHHRQGESFQYPFIFQGRTLINSYIGSFVTGPENTIKFSETIKSHVNGTDQIDRFQEKFHFALQSTEKYSINDNLLMLYFENGERDLLFFAHNDTITF